MDKEIYNNILLEKDDEFEAICKRCGACCGAFDDSCSNLERLEDGKYSCKDYANRLGPQVTVSGNNGFNCVSIREHIKAGSLRACCAYRVR